jgi:Fe-S-cluster containining protein
MPSEPDLDDLFECRMCGDCCRGYGGTYVSESDIKVIAEFLQVDPAEFKNRFCQLSGSRYVLAQAENGYCVFWDELCQIHPVKPRMCRNWPYIAAVLEDVSNWRIMGASCPGIRTDLSDDIVCRTIARRIEDRRNTRRNQTGSLQAEDEASDDLSSDSH